MDELYERKYAVKEEDVVEAIDVGAFRQSVREKGSRARRRESDTGNGRRPCPRQLRGWGW